jgi:ribosome-binding factor A|nr:30S ribosome-binding factor RbfA [Fimbriiglobus sp.]
MKTHRLARIAEVVREVAANTILFEIRDPRVKGVTVTRCEVSADLQHAKVYVSVMGTEKQQRDALVGLRNAAGFIQSKLADRLATRFLPVLGFVVDEGVKKSIEVARILAEERKLRGEVDPPAVDADAASAEDDDDAEDEADAGSPDGTPDAR